MLNQKHHSAKTNPRVTNTEKAIHKYATFEYLRIKRAHDRANQIKAFVKAKLLDKRKAAELLKLGDRSRPRTALDETMSYGDLPADVVQHLSAFVPNEARSTVREATGNGVGRPKRPRCGVSRLVKGSAAAKAFMAKLRSLRHH